MPEYDALGREVGEDTLAGLRGERDDAASATPAPQPAQAQAQAPTRPGPARPPARPTFPGRRSGMGPLRFIPLVIVAVVVAGVIASASHTVRSVTQITVPDFHVPTVPHIPVPHTPVPGPAPTGLTGDSMLRPANLRHALAQLRAGRGARLRFLRVAPDRVDAQVSSSGGRLELLQVTPDSQVATRVSVSGGGPSAADTIPVRAVDPAAPARLIRTAARRAHVRPGEVEYAVLLSLNGDARWSALLGAGGQWLGDRRGRVLQKVG